MTTLPERLQDVIVEFRRIAKDHEIKADRPHQDDSTRQWHMGTSEAYDDAADRLEAAQALQAAPEGGWAVDDSMVERAADAYEAAAESEGFGRVEGSERVTHLRFIRAAIDAALQAGTP